MKILARYSNFAVLFPRVLFSLQYSRFMPATRDLDTPIWIHYVDVKYVPVVEHISKASI